MKVLRPVAAVLKVLLGVLFLVSAVSKFITVDAFEIYVYSFGFFGLTLSYYVARIVIALELILGAALISNRHHRFTMLMSILFLLCFILFLAYAHFSGRTDNCHCFGDLMPFSPVESIMKNALLVFLLLFVYRYQPVEWVPRWWLVVAVYLCTGVLMLLYMEHSLHIIDTYSLVLLFVMMCVGVLVSFPFYDRWFVTVPMLLTPLVTVFILTPPDSWFFTGPIESYDKELFYDQLAVETADTVLADTVAVDTIPSGTLASYGLADGHRMVAFFSPGCGYCRLAAEKVATIARRCQFDSTAVLYVFPEVRDTSRYDDFYSETRSLQFPKAVVPKVVFLKITRGAFPLILMLDGGEVVTSYSYRNVDEKGICGFMKQTENE